MATSSNHNVPVEIQWVALYAFCDWSPVMQLRELREYVSRRGWSVAGEFVDHGVSGSKDTRPQLNRLMAAAQRREFDALVVWNIDRFPSRKLLINTLAELDACGVAFVSFGDNLDLSTPEGRVVWGAICSELIRERARWNARRIPPSPKTDRRQPGESWGEHALREMRANGVPITRENYLQRYFGDPNYEPDAEEEIDMPDQFRRLIGPTPR